MKFHNCHHANTGESRYFAAATKEEAEEWMRKLRYSASTAKALYRGISSASGASASSADHHLQTSSDMHIMALEQEFEDEVLHQCSVESSAAAAAASGLSRLVQQEWRIKHQSSDASCR